MATYTLHPRTLDAPEEMFYFGKIVGYSENTLTAEYDPDNLGEAQHLTVVETQNNALYPMFDQVFEGANSNILVLKAVEPAVPEAPEEVRVTRRKVE